ncbi:MAG: efflux RND transporter periplasmic adaptor subunit [Bacteroidetes bacterium]|nr:efflux RND transporter periplasmic adaptor subunit [Bacteroidota bacterium]
MKKYMKLIGLITAAIGISISIISCSNNKGAQQKFPPTPVVAYQIKPEKAFYYDEYPATVTALNQVEIRPEVSGYITDIYFNDGQQISKGSKLYSIDQQQYKAAYEQAVANLNAAKANLLKAQQDNDRYNELAKNDAIAKQVLQHAQADLDAAKNQVAAAQANVNFVQTNFRNSTIYAPFNGTIGISQVKLGSAVTAGQTLMNTISSNNPMAVDFEIDESQIARFNKLQNKKTNDKDSTFTLQLPDLSIYPYYGKLILLDRAVDPQTGTLRVRLVFPNPNNLLKPGLTCNVRVLNTTQANSIIIPFKAVIEQMGEYFVYVIKNGKVSQQRINIGMNIFGNVIVKDGLNVGDLIVTEGVQKLKDNSPVVIIPAGSKSTPKTAMK